jgi:hypothetical protein
MILFFLTLSKMDYIRKNYADFIMLLMAQPKPNEDYLQLMEESCDLLSNRVQRDS